MPIGSNGDYVAPIFVDNSPPALSAQEMNGMAGAAAGAVKYDRTQTLNASQQQRVAQNGALVSTLAQTLSENQKQQVIANLGVLSQGTQSLTDAQKKQVAANTGSVATFQQNLTPSQQQQARENIGGAAQSVGESVLVPASGWQGQEAPYTITVNCSIATETNKIVVGPDSTKNTYEQRLAIASAMISPAAQGNGTIQLVADGTVPETDFYMNVLEVG